MLNRVVLQGRLAADPELRYTVESVPVCSFAIAVQRNFVKAGEERKADFFDIVVWRSTAEFLCKYFVKGSLIIVEGSLQTRNYVDKNNMNRKVVEVVASDIYFCESKKDNGGGGHSYERQAPSIQPPPQSGYSNGNAEDFQVAEADDDLPF